MINKQWLTLEGIVKPGYQVASGRSQQSPYPKGTIEMQIPFFQQLGLDLSVFFPATLNVSIFPHHFIIQKPEYTFRQVEWYPSLKEDFSFSRCRVEFNDINYESLVYYPHPETKPAHSHDSSTLEIIAPFIPHLDYGNKIILKMNILEIAIQK